VLQIHEHQRPIEAPRINNGIYERSAIVQVRDILLMEITVQVTALRFQFGHFPARLFRASAKFRVHFASVVDVPSQSEKNKSCNNRGKTSARQKPAVRLQRPGCNV
jgi:hypothetical protein